MIMLSNIDLETQILDGASRLYKLRDELRAATKEVKRLAGRVNAAESNLQGLVGKRNRLIEEESRAAVLDMQPWRTEPLDVPPPDTTDEPRACIICHYSNGSVPARCDYCKTQGHKSQWESRTFQPPADAPPQPCANEESCRYRRGTSCIHPKRQWAARQCMVGDDCPCGYLTVSPKEISATDAPGDAEKYFHQTLDTR